MGKPLMSLQGIRLLLLLLAIVIIMLCLLIGMVLLISIVRVGLYISCLGLVAGKDIEKMMWVLPFGLLVINICSIIPHGGVWHAFVLMHIVRRVMQKRCQVCIWSLKRSSLACWIVDAGLIARTSVNMWLETAVQSHALLGTAYDIVASIGGVGGVVVVAGGGGVGGGAWGGWTRGGSLALHVLQVGF